MASAKISCFETASNSVMHDRNFTLARRIPGGDLLKLNQIRPPRFGICMDTIEMRFVPKPSPLQIHGPFRISKVAQGLD